MLKHIPCLRVGQGVKFDHIAPAGFRILAALDGATKVLSADLEITSGTDSHAAGRHPAGEAYDVSVKGFTVPQVVKVRRFLMQTLGGRFTVLYETPVRPSDPDLLAIAFVNPDATGPHLHLQPVKGTVWPPEEPVNDG